MYIQWNLSNPGHHWGRSFSEMSEGEMHARVVIWGWKRCPIFRDVSSIQRCPYSGFVFLYVCVITSACSQSSLATPFPRFHSTPQTGVSDHTHSTSGPAHRYGAREAWAESSRALSERVLPNGFHTVRSGNQSCMYTIAFHAVCIILVCNWLSVGRGFRGSSVEGRTLRLSEHRWSLRPL